MLTANCMQLIETKYSVKERTIIKVHSMPTTVFASSKGGVGKSTAAVLFATELAEAGATVTIIDGDPNKPVSDWAGQGEIPKSLRVIGDVTEKTIIDVIEAEEKVSTHVIVDLEGSASMMVAYAISRADLVILPVQGSQLDAREAAKSVVLVRQQEKAFGKTIPHRILYTRTNSAIRPRTLKDVQAQIKDAGFPRLDVEIYERDAFRAIFSFGGTLYTLNPKQVSSLDAAIANARSFAHEVLSQLVELYGTEKSEAVAENNRVLEGV
ncbi:Protein virC1 [Methylococcales bacterium]|nr:Protein virC1 [Methylococcales bacterium]